MIEMIFDSLGLLMLLLLSMLLNGDGQWLKGLPFYGKLYHQHYYQSIYSLMYWYGVFSFFPIKQNTFTGLEVFIGFFLLEIVLFIWLSSPLKNERKEVLLSIGTMLKSKTCFFELKDTKDLRELRLLLQTVVFPLLFFTANAYLLVGLLFTFNLL
ncbi:hypothetical protein [Cellulophaga sp. BC115SP]|uniref:hypothetical protein n=1 Tax=Cellulophaga sp. BC115SP TaxID=2683263 RepID=UPI001411BC01|nr:hypothetical protein [Cellulophaga sp. BC115SP]NBB29928.1 hypothetical protein [Cellulophaga sp. BC115SP]